MSKRLTFVCIILLVLGMIVDANAASTLKMTCNGNLTNNREDGVTLGNCDLNFIKVKEMTEIENVCGIPGTVDSPAENQCRIRAVVAPDPSSAADHRKLYKVLEVWSVLSGETKRILDKIKHSGAKKRSSINSTACIAIGANVRRVDIKLSGGPWAANSDAPLVA
jgi:hypothetical protein